MAHTQGQIISGTISQQSTGADYIRKVREERTKLYNQVPHEDLKEFPFTKLVMTKKGSYIKNFKHSWYLQQLPYEFDSVTIVSATNANENTPPTVTFNGSAGLFSKITPRLCETFCLTAQNSSGVTTHRLQLEYTGTSSGNHVFNVLWDENKAICGFIKDGYNVAKTTDPLAQGLDTAGMTIQLQKSYTSFPEGSGLPKGRFQAPIELYNYSQTIMEAFSVTGSELADLDIFDESKYNRYVKQTLRSFNNQIEQLIRYGVRYKDTKTNYDNEEGQRTFCGGLEYFIKKCYPENVFDITNLGSSDTLRYNFTGKTWEEGAYDFIKCLLTYLGKTSVRRKTLIASVDVIKNINDVLESMTNVNVQPRVKNEWGFEVTRITTTLCDLDLLIDYHASLNKGLNSIVWVISPDMIEYRPRMNRDITVIKSLKDLPTKVENGFTWRDATKEGIFVDFSLELNYMEGASIIYNWGQDFKAS